MITTGIVATAAANGEVSGQHVVVDDVAEHLVGTADDLHRDVVTQGQGEREDRARHDRREQHRQHDPTQGHPRPGAKVDTSSREFGSRSSPAYIGRIMYGSHR